MPGPSYTFKITRDDFLAYHLFSTSVSEDFNSKGRKGRFTTFILFLLAGAAMFYTDRTNLGIYFLVISVISLAFYPLYLKWLYKRHFTKICQNTLR